MRTPMGLQDDGDIIRGLGFVALYAGYLEEGIDECAAALSLPPNKRPRPASEKARHCVKRTKALGVDIITDALERSIALLESRNEMIHGRFYEQVHGPDIRKSGRPGKSTVEVTSAELYSLADEILKSASFLGHVADFYIPDALRNVQLAPMGDDA
jgi:hypothetical protein